MTMQDALAQQPTWVQVWATWLIVGGFIAPLGLLFWRQTRLAGIAALVAGIAAAIGTQMLFDRLGYVKLLGLGHIVVWTPLLIYLIYLLRQDLPTFARWLIYVTAATILISLAFDYTDVLRYLLGDHAVRAIAPAQ
jgi:hypothetical protein